MYRPGYNAAEGRADRVAKWANKTLQQTIVNEGCSGTSSTQSAREGLKEWVGVLVHIVRSYFNRLTCTPTTIPTKYSSCSANIVEHNVRQSVLTFCMPPLTLTPSRPAPSPTGAGREGGASFFSAGGAHSATTAVPPMVSVMSVSISGLPKFTARGCNPRERCSSLLSWRRLLFFIPPPPPLSLRAQVRACRESKYMMITRCSGNPSKSGAIYSGVANDAIFIREVDRELLQQRFITARVKCGVDGCLSSARNVFSHFILYIKVARFFQPYSYHQVQDATIAKPKLDA